MYFIEFIDGSGNKKYEKHNKYTEYKKKIKVLTELYWKIIKHGEIK